MDPRLASLNSFALHQLANQPLTQECGRLIPSLRSIYLKVCNIVKAHGMVKMYSANIKQRLIDRRCHQATLRQNPSFS